MPSSSDAARAPAIASLERGLCASWTRQVHWSGGGSLHRLGGLLVALSAVPDQTQQVAVIERPVTDPEASIGAAEVLFRQAGWDPAVDLVAGAHPVIERVLEARGYRVVADRAGMVMALDAPHDARPPPGIEIRPAGVDDRLDIVEAQARAFGLEPAIAAQLLPPTAFGDPGLAVLVAVDKDTGRVVGCACVHLDGVVAGLVGAGVDPRHQRRGIGRALTRGALALARAAGAGCMWLQSTPAGEALYRRVGFSTVGSCQVWLVSHREDPELHPGPRPTGL